MKYLCLMIVMNMSLALAFGQATQPAGCPVSGKTGPAMGSGTLPAGHPQVQANQPNLPAGHPQIPGNQPALPPGHPQMADKGTIDITVVQGTKGAAALAAETVLVDLYSNGQVIQTAKATLKADGKATVTDLPLAIPFQPVVRIVHNGVTFDAPGLPMDRTHPGLQVQLPVYELAEKEPDWNVKMRHVMVAASEQGLVVMEMMAINVPGDRAWAGTADGANKRVTMVLPMPAGVKEAQMISGAHADIMPVQDGKLVYSLPLLPGMTKLQLQYVLPIIDGKVDLSITAPRTVGHLMVFIPNDSSTVTATGMESLGVQKMQNGTTRAFKAAGLRTGQEVRLQMSGLKVEARKAEADPIGEDAQAVKTPSHVPQIVAGVGGGLVLLGGAAVILIKGPKTQSKRG